jgi:hypothetical protein
MFTKTRLRGSLLLAFLAGCAGGGGGGGGPAGDPPPVAASPAPAPASPAAPAGDPPFTSFSAIQPSQTVVMSGISQPAAISFTDGSQTTVTAFTAGTVDTSARFSFTYDASRTLSGVKIESMQSNMSFGAAAGDSISCSATSCTAEDQAHTKLLAFVNSPAAGWNYQTFGFWGAEATSNTILSAFSAGSATPAGAVPQTGSALFAGRSMGMYVDPTGAYAGTNANMTANVNFQSRSIAFSTNATTLNPSTAPTAAPGLNLSGVFTYGAGSNQFNGTVVSANGTLNGSSTGQFYGPNAEELGGTYALSGSGTMRMIGAYGGKR